ncbi:peroxiredoxin [Desulfovibrio inopinatus]|uniref:peroxiredoxin n=1 Tax=Desulfovibrio inopinatus TaxID=102109 RepID=UPI0003F814FB|nr:peroxiredoxin [Desulfovibrio inopinatus]
MTSDVQIQSSPMPRIGDLAPQFAAETTQGLLHLEDFKGTWVVMFSHPADFTPVCTTEFIAFAKAHSQFQKMGCELLGLSIDSIFSHIAWTKNIEKTFGQKITFPIIADQARSVAMLYGMIMPGESKTETSRCVFVIDDKQVIRAIIYYPLTTGRNVDEILRLVTALKTTDEHGVATPANWKPGDEVIVPPPRTQDAADDQLGNTDTQCLDWYFCKKTLKS